MPQQMEVDSSVIPSFLSQYYKTLLSDPGTITNMYCYTHDRRTIGQVTHQGRDVSNITDITDLFASIYFNQSTDAAVSGSSSSLTLEGNHHHHNHHNLLIPLYSGVVIHNINNTDVLEDTSLKRIHVTGALTPIEQGEYNNNNNTAAAAATAVPFEHNITISINDQQMLGIISDMLSIIMPEPPISTDIVTEVERVHTPVEAVTNWADHTPELLAKRHEEIEEEPGFHIALPPATGIDLTDTPSHDTTEDASAAYDNICVRDLPSSSSGDADGQAPMAATPEKEEEVIDLSSLTFAERLRLNATGPKKPVVMASSAPEKDTPHTANSNDKHKRYQSKAGDVAGEGKRHNNNNRAGKHQRTHGDNNNNNNNKEKRSGSGSKEGSYKKDTSSHHSGKHTAPIATN
eukprot:Tbor_TRINITY_DN5303_c7_g2::TRINITY_DN5303_c7_g2_i3::g.4011::m.4011